MAKKTKAKDRDALRVLRWGVTLLSLALYNVKYVCLEELIYRTHDMHFILFYSPPFFTRLQDPC